MSSPPEVDEAYWSALLQEGEMIPEEEAASMPTSWDEVEFAEHHEFIELTDDHHFPQASDWLEMRTFMDSDLSLELPVIGSNRGGLLVQWKSLRGFVPAKARLQSISTGEYMPHSTVSTPEASAKRSAGSGHRVP